MNLKSNPGESGVIEQKIFSQLWRLFIGSSYIVSMSSFILWVKFVFSLL